MGVHQDRWYHYVNMGLLRRKFDLKRTVVIVTAVLTFLMLAFEITHHELYSLVPFRSISVPGQCTTWPVGHDGRYTPETVMAAQSNETSSTTSSAPRLDSLAPPGGWKKPEGIKVVALIFYGRKRTVDFLDCYIQQNLVSNGGYLDEVRFMVHTSNKEDLDYLQDLVAKSEGYYHVVDTGECEGMNFSCIWDSVVEDDTIYVKIDDDIIFIHPDAIPQLVHTRIATPHAYAVSANLVNSPLTGYEHFHYGAIHPFLPDPRAKPSHPAAESWRPSERGYFPNSSMPTFNVSSLSDAEVEELVYPKRPYFGHPFLLLSDNPFDLMKSPMGLNHIRGAKVGVETAYRVAWESWAVAAQQQYSLLKNLEENAVARYFFGSPQSFPTTTTTAPNGTNQSTAVPERFRHHALNAGGPGGEQLYNTQYRRYNLNFIAVWGSDIAAALPIAGDDEQDITVDIPLRTHRPFLIDTRAVVGHLSFFPQHEGVRETDLLDRWRAFANEMICAPGNRKSPFDKRCPGF